MHMHMHMHVYMHMYMYVHMYLRWIEWRRRLERVGGATEQRVDLSK